MKYVSADQTATRIVTDRQWIHRNELSMGMLVVELDVPWEQTSFMFQGFRIDSAEQLRQVQQECEYALIQSEKVAKVNRDNPLRLCGFVKGKTKLVWDHPSR